MQYLIMDMEKRGSSYPSNHNHKGAAESSNAKNNNNNNTDTNNGVENGNAPKATNKGRSIAERRAGKFTAPSINTARYRTISPFGSPSGLVSPTCLTIPSGISPSALLDSPMMLPNSQAQLSPTTGTFPFPPFPSEGSVPNSAISTGSDKASNGGVNSRLKPSCYSAPFASFSALENQDISADKQDKYLMDTPMDFSNEMDSSQEVAEKNSPMDSCSNLEALTHTHVKASSPGCTYDGNNGQVLPDKESTNVYDEGAQSCEGDQKEAHSSLGIGKTSEDGYNWRKYGQKQVKGSEYPRSYYKCTHPNCQVKKKVERSHDGQITEIIYKGAHNHLKPQSIRRGPPGSAFSLGEISEMGDATGTAIQMEDGPIWRNIPFGARDIKHGSDWRQHDVLDRTSPTSVVTELSDPLSTNSKRKYVFESVKTPELSSTLASHDEEDEDGDVQGSISVDEGADDEEPEPQRIKLENGDTEPNMATMASSRAIREPRVVIQIRSDVDILDDGYRWRKYGQKVVKGNPNPRSYYKCTTAGCIVRKHVERASHDLTCVLTTYEGKHNHEVPAARNSNHAPPSCGSLPPAASSSNAILTIPRNPTIHKPESHVGDREFAAFDKKPQISNELLGSGLFANICNDMKFGASSMYAMKFHPFQSPSPIGRGSFGLNASANAMNSPRDYPLSLSHNKFYNCGKITMKGFDCNNNGGGGGFGQGFLPGQQITEREMRFLTPKKEEKDDSLYDACHPMVSPASASSGTFYPRAFGSFTT